jgi:hypothetical protein
MSQDNRYQFHMGCGESLLSQWWQTALPVPVVRKEAQARRVKPAAGHGQRRGGRKE